MKKAKEQPKCPNGHPANSNDESFTKKCPYQAALRNSGPNTCSECYGLNGTHTNICSQS